MKSAAFTHYDDIYLTVIGLGLFLAVFVGVIVWTGLRANRAKYLRMANAPLLDDEAMIPGGQR